MWQEEDSGGWFFVGRVVPLLEPIMTFADIILAFSELILHASPCMHAPEFEGIATESVNVTTECQVKTDNKDAM